MAVDIKKLVAAIRPEVYCSKDPVSGDDYKRLNKIVADMVDDEQTDMQNWIKLKKEKGEKSQFL